MDENCVAPYRINPKLKQHIRPLFASKIFCFQTRNVTANHPNNCANIWWLFWDSSDIWEVTSNLLLALILDQLSFVVATFSVDEVDSRRPFSYKLSSEDQSGVNGHKIVKQMRRRPTSSSGHTLNRYTDYISMVITNLSLPQVLHIVAHLVLLQPLPECCQTDTPLMWSAKYRQKRDSTGFLVVVFVVAVVLLIDMKFSIWNRRFPGRLNRFVCMTSHRRELHTNHNKYIMYKQHHISVDPSYEVVYLFHESCSEPTESVTLGAFACSRLKLLKKHFGREHTVAVRKRSWVQDGLWLNQSCPLPIIFLTHRLELNDRSRFVILTQWSSLFAVTLTFA